MNSTNFRLNSRLDLQCRRINGTQSGRRSSFRVTVHREARPKQPQSCFAVGRIKPCPSKQQSATRETQVVVKAQAESAAKTEVIDAYDERVQEEEEEAVPQRNRKAKEEEDDK